MRRLSALFGLILVFTVSGCVQFPLTGGNYDRDEARVRQLIEYGTVVELKEVDINAATNEYGGLGGAVLGGAVGSGIGHGAGRTIAAAAGAVAGAVAGDAIQKKAGERDGVEITVKHDDGKLYAYVQEIDPEAQFKVGDKVKILTQGGTSRVKHYN